MQPRPADLVAALVARASATRAKDVERARALRACVRSVARRLRAEGQIDGAWLIGSLAWGTFGERSDVDVVVRGTEARNLGTLWRALGEELDAEVDVLRIEELAPTFARRVLAEGVRLDEP